MAKYYAVKNGRNIGIFTSWEECQAQTDGFSGAEYKAFGTKTAAKEYLGIIAPKTKKDAVELPVPNSQVGVPVDDAPKTDSCAAAYVDGSYNVRTGEFAFGAVLFVGGKMFTFSHCYADAELAEMRNVAGEIKGAEFVMKYAAATGIKSIDIFYDYAGIENWALGRWKTNKNGTRAYKALCDEHFKKLHVRFVKVKGHSDDKYNDLADRLAKDAVGNP